MDIMCINIISTNLHTTYAKYYHPVDCTQQLPLEVFHSVSALGKKAEFCSQGSLAIFTVLKPLNRVLVLNIISTGDKLTILN